MDLIRWFKFWGAAQGLQYGTEPYKNAEAVFCIDGSHIPGPNTLYYLGDAVDIYERRRDDFQGQTALLFAPSCPHIEALRHIIHVLKDSEMAFPVGSPEHDATLAVEQALNNVQQNNYLPKTVKQDKALLRVRGYASGYEIHPYGKGLIVREYSNETPLYGRYKGKAVIEMSSDEVLPHLFERNVIVKYGHGGNDSPVDIVAVSNDGITHRFNYYRKDNGEMNSAGTNYPTTEPEVAALFKAAQESCKEGVGSVLSPEQVACVEKHFLPYLAQQRPPLVDITAKVAR